MVVAGRVTETGDVAIMMVEAEATEQTFTLVEGGAQAPTEEVVASGLDAAKPFIKQLCEAQSELAKQAAKPVQDFPVFLDYEDDVYAAVEAAAKSDLAAAMTIADKQEREARTDELKAALLDQLGPQFEGREKEIGAAFRSVNKQLVRERVLRDKVRIDGRGLADIRPLHAEVGVIPRVHGSALFERGETQILGVTTLDMLKMEQKLDTLSPEKHRRYMHKYVFPPFSTGETGRVGSPKRREVGHGALARRALLPVLPTREEFPYAIRQLSEAMGSNGSTSMGSVCASTMSLLHAGVPLKAPVAGIAMGLISGEVDGETQYVALTDILGAEDAFGDMDFKVAGTREFVTALQLDTKLDGIPAEVLAAALTQARDARLAILDVMAEAIDEPEEMSPTAPRIITIKIPVDKIGEVIGPKGKVINQIQDDTGASISIEDDGTIYIGADQRRRGRGRPRPRSTRSPTRRCPRSASATSAPSSRRPTSAPSSRCSRARTACCTSASCVRWPAASGSRTSRTSSRSARRSRSRSPRSTTAASCRWSRWSRTARRRGGDAPADRGRGCRVRAEA